jgi:glucose/arabinose dehydrogenase
VCREADARRAAILSYAADGSDARVVRDRASRNPVGLAFHPVTGMLWTTVNERDWRAGGCAAGLRDRGAGRRGVRLAGLLHAGRRLPADPELPQPRPCRGLTAPTLELPPHSAPLGMAFQRASLFVALHGSRAELPAAGYALLRIGSMRAAPPARTSSRRLARRRTRVGAAGRRRGRR